MRTRRQGILHQQAAFDIVCGTVGGVVCPHGVMHPVNGTVAAIGGDRAVRHFGTKVICGGIGAQDEHPRLRLAAVLVEILCDGATIGGLADDFAEVAAWCGLGDFLVVGIVVKGLHLARDIGDASSLCCRAVGVQYRLRQGVVHAQRHVDAAYRHHPHTLRVAAHAVE